MPAREEYERRLVERVDLSNVQAAAVHRTQDLRLLIFFIGLVVLGFALWGRISGGWLWLPFAMFVLLVRRHSRQALALAKTMRAVDFYRDGIDRLSDRWAGRGVTGERFVDTSHPYSSDLDLFGEGALFELLCGCRTRAGEDALASWLLAPAPLAEIGSRQEAVRELRDALDLREDLSVLHARRTLIDHASLAHWGGSPVLLSGRLMRVAAFVLGFLSFAALAAWAVGFSGLPFLVMLIIGQVFALAPGPRVRQVVHASEGPKRDLSVLVEFLERVEQASFQAPRLQSIAAALADRPSLKIRKLLGSLEYLEARHNPFFAPFGVVLLWSMQWAYVIEEWRAIHGRHVGDWTRALGELEVLLSLASHAYEHPSDVFPSVTSEGPRFQVVGLGHPLIPRSRCVTNDLSLESGMQLLVVSGSNMSGKSSLLRAVGVGAVMAQAGGPVYATSLSMSLLAVGSCIRTSDSLREGISRFYAEIKRIRQIVDIAGGPMPLLFLLDEILHGTNSHDRAIGAAAIVRTLVSRGAVGLVTTHDLALTRIADELSPRAINVHFEDHLEEGHMKFDYILKPGVVEKSNAIALMRSVGLDV